MTTTPATNITRWALMAAICGWLSASSCLCYGGGEPPPEDDDSAGDDDATNDTNVPDYDVEGFYLDIGKDLGGGLYGGIVVLETGALSEWSGLDGFHQDEAWVATLTEGQMDELIHALGPDAFFASSIDEGGEPDCVLEFRLGLDANEAVHEAGEVPPGLENLYRELDLILSIFGVEHGCS